MSCLPSDQHSKNGAFAAVIHSFRVNFFGFSWRTEGRKRWILLTSLIDMPFVPIPLHWWSWGFGNTKISLVARTGHAEMGVILWDQTKPKSYWLSRLLCDLMCSSTHTSCHNDWWVSTTTKFVLETWEFNLSTRLHFSRSKFYFSTAHKLFPQYQRSQLQIGVQRERK